MFELYDVLRDFLNNWKTRDQCVKFICKNTIQGINERTFRNFVANFNKMYEAGDTEMFIAHSNKGYKLTTNPEIIMNSLEDDYKRAVKLMKRYWRCKKALSDKNQLTLTDEEIDMFEVIKKMEEE